MTNCLKIDNAATGYGLLTTGVNLTTAWTILTVARIDTDTNANAALVTLLKNGALPPRSSLMTGSDGTTIQAIYLTDPIDFGHNSAGIALTVGTWYLLSLRFDGTTMTLGSIPIGSTTLTKQSVTDADSAHPLCELMQKIQLWGYDELGEADPPGQRPTASQASLLIYSAVLTDDEVKAQALQRVPVRAANLFHFARMNAAVTTQIPDESGGLHHIPIVGTAPTLGTDGPTLAEGTWPIATSPGEMIPTFDTGMSLQLGHNHERSDNYGSLIYSEPMLQCRTGFNESGSGFVNAPPVTIAKLDFAGWPLDVPAGRLCNQLFIFGPSTIPAGNYTLTWDNFAGDFSALLLPGIGYVFFAGTGSMTFDWTPMVGDGQAGYLLVQHTPSGPPPKNFRLFKTSVGPSAPDSSTYFNPTWKEAVSRSGLQRFMDVLGTNSSRWGGIYGLEANCQLAWWQTGIAWRAMGNSAVRQNPIEGEHCVGLTSGVGGTLRKRTHNRNTNDGFNFVSIQPDSTDPNAARFLAGEIIRTASNAECQVTTHAASDEFIYEPVVYVDHASTVPCAGITTRWSPERVAEMVNHTRSDCWVTLPDMCTPAAAIGWLTRLFSLVWGGCKVWVEFSNECWNAAFNAYFNLLGLANDLGYTGGDIDKVLKAQAKRHCELMVALEAEFSAHLASGRFIRVISSQMANYSFADILLDFNTGGAVTAGGHFDAYGGAPYISDDNVAATNNATMKTQCLLHLTTTLEPAMQALKTNIVTGRSKRAVCYEAGIDLQTHPREPLYANFYVSSEIGDVMTALIDSIFTNLDDATHPTAACIFNTFQKAYYWGNSFGSDVPNFSTATPKWVAVLAKQNSHIWAKPTSFAVTLPIAGGFTLGWSSVGTGTDKTHEIWLKKAALDDRGWFLYTTKAANSGATTHAVSGLDAGAYDCEIRAKNNKGRSRALSGQASTVDAPAVPVAAILDLVTPTSATSFHAARTLGSGGATATGSRVEWRTNPAGSWNDGGDFDPVTGTVEVTGVTTTLIDVSVISFNAAGDAARSNIQSVDLVDDPEPPDPVVINSVIQTGPGDIHGEFIPAATGDAATGYRVYLSVAELDDYALVATLGSSENDFDLSGLAEGDYDLKVLPFNGGGVGGESNVQTVTIVPDIAHPAPTNLLAVPDGDIIAITFERETTNLVRTRVERSTVENFATKEILTYVPVSYDPETQDVTPGAQLWYYRAINEFNDAQESVPSNVDSAQVGNTGSNESFLFVDRPTFGRFYQEATVTAKFAADGLNRFLKRGTAIAFDTGQGKWVPWVAGGPSGEGTVRSFVFPDGIQLKTTGEVLATVLFAGRVHINDVSEVTTGTATSQLKAALRAGILPLSRLGIVVEGLTGIIP